MYFQILSHACLLVKGSGKTLLFDPWLVGSAYWRSWWNYPPVPRSLWESLQPDFIAITHIHWDHFHGPSLRKFARETPILIPRGHALRMKKDLNAMGFLDVRELRHGETRELAPGFTFTSYQFYPFTDSGVVVECEGVKLFNANDAKFMGAPLDQILKRHPGIDFVFRSHSSANPRICFDFTDAPFRTRDEPERYLKDFANFARKVGARYAIPFASNHCYLHRETFHLNDTVITPLQVEEYCRARSPGYAGSPEVKVMVAGDSWQSDSGNPEIGFKLAQNAYFLQRERCLRAYAAEQSGSLEKSYALEARSEVSLAQFEGYFSRFLACLPWVLRRPFKGKPVTYVLTGRRTSRFWVDIYNRKIREVGPLEDALHPLQVHTSAYIFRRCMALGLFIHLGISKRVLFRSRREDAKRFWLLITLFDLYECEMLPLRRLLAPRFLSTWLPRWREVLLYAAILARKATGREFAMEDYLRTDARAEGEFDAGIKSLAMNLQAYGQIQES